MPVDLAELMMGLHRGLDALLLEHRIALMDGDLDRARHLFGRYATAMRTHAQDEEDLILPLFAARGGEDLDSPPRLFEGEHRKIRDFLDSAQEQLDALEAGDRAGALALLDAGAWYVNLLMHHDLREQNVLYPRITEWTTAAERAAIVDQLRLRDVSPGE